MSRSVAGGTAALLLARLAPPAASLGVFYLALLHWEPGTWGLFHLLLAAQAILQMASGLGVDLLVLQKGTAHPQELPRLLRAASSLLIRVGVGLGAAMVLFVALVTDEPQSLLAASFLAGAIPAASLAPTLEASWVSAGLGHRLAPIVMLEQGTRLLASFAVLTAGGGPALVALAFFVSKWFGTALLFRPWRHLPETATPPSLGAVLRQASPFAFFFAASALLARMDSLVLALFLPLTEVGFYGAATRLVFFCTIASQAFGLALYPYLVASRSNPERYRRIASTSLTSLAVVSFVPASFLHAFPATTLRLLHVDAYLPAASLLAILSLLLPALFSSEILFRCLLAEERVRGALKVTVVQIATGLPVLVAGGSLYGAQGVATGSVLVAWLGALGYLFTCHQNALTLWMPWAAAMALGGAVTLAVRMTAPSQPGLALLLIAVFALAALGHAAARWHGLSEPGEAGE